MCELCELQSRLHIAYLLKRDKNNLMDGDFSYDDYHKMDAIATRTAKKAIDKVKSGQVISSNKVAQILFIAESKALGFAEQFLNREQVKAFAHIAKDFETLRAALTLIQSKALLSGDDVIKQIATDALEKQVFNFGQSAKEIEEIAKKIESED